MKRKMAQFEAALQKLEALSKIAQGTTLSSGLQISGIITDGVNPISATVQAWQNGTMVKEVETPDGSYVISGLQTGTYAIRAYSAGYYTAVLPDEITPPATDVDFSLTQAPHKPPSHSFGRLSQEAFPY